MQVSRLAPAPGWVPGLATLRAPLGIGLALLSVAALFWPTLRELLALGQASDSPIALALLACLAMVWLRRKPLASLAIRPFWPGLLALAGLGALWLVGQLSFTRLLVDAAVLGMVPVLIWVMFGHRWLLGMALPLLFLLFVLPLGRPLTPRLVEWTTRITVAGLELVRIPVFRDGTYLALPSGNWLVADSCAGTEYLLTCLLLGLFYAWLLYASPGKRCLFVAGAILLGVLGNGIRASLTLIIAHASNNSLLREDHSSFGWLLFAVFMLAYGGLGWHYRDEAQLQRMFRPADLALEPSVSGRKVLLAWLASLLVLVPWPLSEQALARPAASGPLVIAGITPQNGWQVSPRPAVPWLPAISKPELQRVQSFEKAGRRVDVFIGLYQHQSWESKLVSINNRLVAQDQRQWAQTRQGVATTRINGQPVQVHSAGIVGRGGRIEAWHWYGLDQFATASSLQAKARQISLRLAGQHDGGAWIAIYTPAHPSPAAATAVLQNFMEEMGVALEQALAATLNGPAPPPASTL